MKKDIINMNVEVRRRGRERTGGRMYIGEFGPRRDIVSFDVTGTDGREVATL